MLQVEELDDKDTRLKILKDEQQKNNKIQNIKEDKIRKDVGAIKKQLNHERGLKLGAFDRVDKLQVKVYDMESALINRVQSSTTMPVTPAPTSGQSLLIITYHKWSVIAYYYISHVVSHY